MGTARVQRRDIEGVDGTVVGLGVQADGGRGMWSGEILEMKDTEVEQYYMGTK